MNVIVNGQIYRWLPGAPRHQGFIDYARREILTDDDLVSVFHEFLHALGREYRAPWYDEEKIVELWANRLAKFVTENRELLVSLLEIL